MKRPCFLYPPTQLQTLTTVVTQVCGEAALRAEYMEAIIFSRGKSLHFDGGDVL